LQGLVNWLVQCGVDTVAMESPEKPCPRYGLVYVTA
jgi:hypothetical protein